jgi:hypothetical protein
MPDNEQPGAVTEETLDPQPGAEQPEGAVGDSVAAQSATASATQTQGATEEEFDLLVGGKTQRVPRSKLIEYAQKGSSYEQKMADLKAQETDMQSLREFQASLAHLEATDPDAAKELADRIVAARVRQSMILPPEVAELVAGNRRTKANAEHKGAFGRDITDEEFAAVSGVAEKRRVSIEDAWVMVHGRTALAEARKAGGAETVARLKAGQTATGASAAHGGSAPTKAKSDDDFFKEMGDTLHRTYRGPEE